MNNATNKHSPDKNVFALLRFSINTLFQNPQILRPFVTLIFIHLLVLEILYFSVRFPLNVFFGPLIAKIYNEALLHYPFNLIILLPKLFFRAQFPIYIFASYFFVGVAIKSLAMINNDEDTQKQSPAKLTLKHYTHIVLAALISYGFTTIFFQIYEWIFNRAQLIRSTTGKFFILKTIVMQGAPYFNLIISIFVTCLFAYVLPIMIIENKKIVAALIENFKTLFRNFWFTFWIVFFPSLVFIPVLLLRNTTVLENIMPEMSLITLTLTILAMVIIDAIIYTSVASYYLLKKESR